MPVYVSLVFATFKDIRDSSRIAFPIMKKNTACHGAFSLKGD